MYADFGLGLGLAYRHNFAENDRFKLAARELAQREQERLFNQQLALEARNERRLNAQKETAGKLAEGYKKPSIRGDYPTKVFDNHMRPLYTELDRIGSDPNWEIDPVKIARVKEIAQIAANHPVIGEAAKVETSYELLKKDHADGWITEDQFKEHEKNYLDYYDNGLPWTYQSRSVDLETKISDFFKDVNPGPDFYGTDKENLLAIEFRDKYKDLVSARWKSFTDAEKVAYKSELDYIKTRGKYIMGEAWEKNVPGGGRNNLTQEEALMNAALQNYQDNFLYRDPATGTLRPDGNIEFVDNGVASFIPRNPETNGYTDEDIYYFNPDGTIATVDIPLDATGIGVVPTKTVKYVKKDGVYYVKTLFKVRMPAQTAENLRTKDESDPNWWERNVTHPDEITYYEDQLYKSFKNKKMITAEYPEATDSKGNPAGYYYVEAYSQANPTRESIKDYYGKTLAVYVPSGTGAAPGPPPKKTP